MWRISNIKSNFLFRESNLLFRNEQGKAERCEGSRFSWCRYFHNFQLVENMFKMKVKLVPVGSCHCLIFDVLDIEAIDTYGFTPLHRMASNNLRQKEKASYPCRFPTHQYKFTVFQPRSKSITGIRSRPAECWKNWANPCSSRPEFKCSRCYQSSSGWSMS